MGSSFAGRVVVITGAGRGLGRAYALLLASEGARVVVNDPGSSMAGEGMDAGPADTVVAEIRAAGGEAVANTDSVATPEGGRAIIAAALDGWGRIDALIHNAGNVRAAPIVDMRVEDFESVLSVHLRGAFHVVQAALPSMYAAGYGRIVLTSSIGGTYGSPTQANYGVAKAGTLGLANVVALEGAEHGVTCNVIVPGAVTRMADGIDISQYPPMGPELVAPVVGWLAHADCSISGEYVAAIAGRVARLLFVEAPGVYHSEWTIARVGAEIDAIRDADAPYVAKGHGDHIGYSFAMAQRGEQSVL